MLFLKYRCYEIIEPPKISRCHWKCNYIRIYIMKGYIELENIELTSFSSILFVTNQSGTNFDVIR